MSADFEVEGRTTGDYSVVRIDGRSYSVSGLKIAVLKHHFPGLKRKSSASLGDSTPLSDMDFDVTGEFVEDPEGVFRARAVPIRDTTADPHELVLTEHEAKQLASS